MLRASFLALTLLLATVLARPALAEGVSELFRDVSTRPGVSVPISLIIPKNVEGAAILLPGGNGLIGIEEDGAGTGRARIKREGNFLVRSRQLFAARGVAVAVMDSPSARREEGMGAGFRISEAHAEDLRALARFVAQATGCKPWLIGTSMGTISAAWGAERLGDDIAGVVLTSSVTRTGKGWSLPGRFHRAALNPGLASVRVPALVTAHRGDACALTPPADARELLDAFQAAPRKALLYFEGGLSPISDPCEAKAQHGYYGIEPQVVEGITTFMLQAP